jgi:monoamine oxidase
MKSVKSLQIRLFKSAFGQIQRQPQPGNIQKTDNSRRNFIKTSLKASLLVGVAPENILNSKILENTSSEKKIIIIGAGLAGLTTAWYLEKAGLKSTIYEGSHRVGGRTLSIRDTFGTGSAVDLGGEFVDEWHIDLRNLIQEIGLETYDLRKSPDHNKKDFVYFQNRVITNEILVKEILPFAESIQKDINLISENISYQKIGAAKQFDDISIAEYLKMKKIDGWLYDYLYNAFTGEYGMEASEQSALNMLTVLKLPKENATSIELIGGEGSEVHKIKGGSMAVCEKIAEKIKSTIHFNEALTKLEKTANNRYQLTFDSQKTEEADCVVLAIPFTKLREIDLKIPLSVPKKQAIQELGYGNSSKLILGFKKPIWSKNGYNGFIFSDLPFANTGWSATTSQKINKKQCAWTLFTGGNTTQILITGDLADNTQTCLDSLQKLIPGFKKKWNKKSMFWHWEQYEWAKAGYSSWKVGQWQAFAGAEGEREENVFFAGEHCSVEFQGFMNGAVQTGRIAAEDIANFKV